MARAFDVAVLQPVMERQGRVTRGEGLEGINRLKVKAGQGMEQAAFPCRQRTRDGGDTGGSSEGLAPDAEDGGHPPIQPHGLRQTYATVAIQAGVSVLIVSRQMWHGSISTMAYRYTHSVPGGNPSRF